MKYPLKPYIDTIHPYEPGKPIDEVKRELGLTDIIKVASNENELGIPPRVRRAIIDNIDSFNRYPDGSCWRLRRKLAAHLGIEENEIIFGNGSNEIIEFIAKGFIDPGDTVISSEYAFLVYPLLTQVCDGNYIEVPAKKVTFDLAAIAQRINEKTKVIFLANPNNPTGTYFTKAEFEAFLTEVPQHVIVCLDEAYVDFVDAADYPNGLNYFRKGNIIVLRTFSKAYGLAGFRIGYGIASKELVEYFNKIRQPFNVNALAQCAAEAALDDDEYVQKTKHMVREGKQFMYEKLSALGLSYIKSETNFILVDIKQDSHKFFKTCLKRGVVVRAMKSYKLDTFVRITVGLPEQNKKVIEVFKKVIGR